MKITYDVASDTLTVVLRDGPARISEEEKSGVIRDYDADDLLIAIEVLDASTRVDGVDTVQLRVNPRPPPSNPPQRNNGRTHERHTAGPQRILEEWRLCAQS